jgi:hypothetical protein
MTRKSGWSDRARIIATGNNDVTSNIGVIRGADHDLDRGGLEARGGVNSGSKRVYIADGISEYNHGLTVHTDNFYVLRFLGTVVGNDLLNVDSLPVFTIRQQATPTQYVEITGAKFGSATIEIEAGEFLSIQMTGMGLGATLENGVLAVLDYAQKPTSHTAIPVKFDGTLIGGLQSISVELNRNLEARGDVGTGSSDPAYIGEGLLNVNISNLTVDIIDDTVWKWVMDKESGDLTLELPNGEVLVLIGAEFDNVDPDEQTSDDAVETVTTSGVALDWKVENIGGV